MAATSIAWTDHSINPLRYGKGHFCQKVSPGCANCYASGLQHRFGNPEFKGVGSGQPMQVQGPLAKGIWLDKSKLQEVLRRKKPTRYFWCDMTDLFGEWVPDEWIDRCFATMALTPQHTHQVLTKRPERMQKYLDASFLPGGILVALDNMDTPEACNAMGQPWPLPNVWLGVSVEDQARKSRIGLLRQVPAAVRFLSLEPLLEDLGTLDLAGIDWCIIGGESGPRARPCRVEWVRSLVAQCAAAGVACFVKQLGAVIQTELRDENNPNYRGYMETRYRDPKGGDPDEWPDDLRAREFPR